MLEEQATKQQQALKTVNERFHDMHHPKGCQVISVPNSPL
jgi:hypothetical protein